MVNIVSCVDNRCRSFFIYKLKTSYEMLISDWSSDVCSSDLRFGDNRELRRLFPSVGMHIIHVQYSMPELQKVRRRDYADMAAAVMKKDAALAEAVARRHVDNVRGAIADWHARRSDGHMGAR